LLLTRTDLQVLVSRELDRGFALVDVVGVN
jgi:hypothetical protein